MTIMNFALAYLLKYHPELFAYLKIEETKYLDPQQGLQN